MTKEQRIIDDLVVSQSVNHPSLVKGAMPLSSSSVRTQLTFLGQSFHLVGVVVGIDKNRSCGSSSHSSNSSESNQRGDDCDENRAV